MLVVAYDNALAEGDIVYDDGTLVEGAAVETAALLSLYMERPAREGDPVPEDEPRRGWWADAYDEDGDVWGSRLWVLSYIGATPEGARFAEDAAREALQWMLDSGLVSELRASASVTSIGHVRLEVEIHKPGELAPSQLGAWDLEVSGALP